MMKEFVEVMKFEISDSRDFQWLTQYQYILNWCYCQMRFISNPAERLRLFLEVKV